MRFYTLIAITGLVMACGGASSPTTQRALAQPPAAGTAEASDDELGRVIGWTLGATHRTATDGSYDAYLLWSQVGAPINREQGVTSCIKASSFLPDPAGGARFFLASEGHILVQNAPNTTPLPVQGADPNLAVTRLLAFSIRSPLQILVAAVPNGESKEQLWLVTFGNNEITGMAPVTGNTALRETDAFFDAFVVPRCQERNRNCLTVKSYQGAYFLDMDELRTVDGSGNARPVCDLGTTKGADAAWVPGTKDQFYLLLACPQKPQ